MSPALTSDLSGTPLEGSNDPTTIRITFGDKSQRDLTVSAAEARSLALKGAEVPRGWGRQMWASISTHPWRILGIIAGAFLTGILVPAVVQQWADRQKELELKNSLVTGISDLTSEAAANAVLIRGDATPEARDRQQAKAELDEAVASGQADEIKEARTRLRNAVAAEIKAEQSLFNQTINALIKNGASYETRLQTYFSDSPTREAWAAARAVFADHLRLTTALNAEERQQIETRILDYLCEGSRSGPKKAPEIIKDACASHVDGETPSGEKFPFVAIGDELNRLLRVRLLGGIRDANADGYSGGFGDLFWAVLPG